MAKPSVGAAILILTRRGINHIRQLLDGVPTAHFDGQFRAIVEDLDAHGALAPMRRLGGRLLVALDGTEFFRSRSIHCPNCSARKRSDGATEHFHQMLAATVVAPGHARTLALAPEFVQRRAGLAKQDCEREAAKRWLQHHGPRCAALRPVYLGDDLYACQPVCRAMLDSGGDFLLTANPGDPQQISSPVKMRIAGGHCLRPPGPGLARPPRPAGKGGGGRTRAEERVPAVEYR